VYTGLRPGEKLYEELLIDAESQPTAHPLIYRARERSMSPEILWPMLDALEDALTAQHLIDALDLLKELVPEWQQSPLACGDAP
jgi:FlaA1/EpsC-like NDP-sugar epimerase